MTLTQQSSSFLQGRLLSQQQAQAPIVDGDEVFDRCLAYINDQVCLPVQRYDSAQC